MCGICGILSLDLESPVDARLLGAMNATLHHRGPDSGGEIIDGPAGLAARRLAIIDLPGGDQPIANEAGDMHVVQNGEIYNYHELRDELHSKGHELASTGDTEVLVHLYEEHGPGFAARLRGMFAIAIWDARRMRLTLARDPFGIKPLYYATHAGRLSFASELKSLLAQPGFPRDVSLDALEAYLMFNWIPGELSIFSAVRRLPAGHVLVADRGGLRVERYARPGVAGAHVRPGTFEEQSRATREVLQESVRAHLVADVPVGVLLSGGVDSSLLTAMAAQASGERIKTFSIGFEDQAFNELDKARLVAQRFDTEHHELVVAPDAVDLLPKIARTYDEPFGDSSALPTYMVSELASRHVKVALAGEGGDELFAGYHTYVADALSARWGGLAGRLRPLADRFPRLAIDDRRDDRLRRFLEGAALEPMERHCSWQQVMSAEMRSELMVRGRGADPLATHRERYAESAGAQPIARFQDLDLGTYLVDDLLLKTDRASMAHSLELRVPFCDPAIARFALSAPDVMRVRRSHKKRLLREAARTLLPAEILDAPKQGFSIPAARWLRHELRDFAGDALSTARLERHGYLSAPAVQSMLAEHQSQRRDRSRQLWGLLMLTLWFDAYGLGAS